VASFLTWWVYWAGRGDYRPYEFQKGPLPIKAASGREAVAQAARQTGYKEHDLGAVLDKKHAQDAMRGPAESVDEDELLKQAFRDWLGGEAYLDRAGKNYRLRTKGTPTSRGADRGVAPWNRLVKRLYPDNQKFHDAAKEYAASIRAAKGYAEAAGMEKPQEPGSWSVRVLGESAPRAASLSRNAARAQAHRLKKEGLRAYAFRPKPPPSPYPEVSIHDARLARALPGLLS
jgi:hypothetical protein